MKNWRTTVLGILGAGLLLATSKGWIDNDIAVFIGTALTALFGIVATDSGSRNRVQDSDEIGLPIPPKK